MDNGVCDGGSGTGLVREVKVGPPRPRVFVAVEEEAARQRLRQLLSADSGLDVGLEFGSSGAEALASLAARPYSLLITAWQLAGLHGRQLLLAVRERRLPFGTVVLIRPERVAEAFEAMRLGAYDVLRRPVDGRSLVQVVRKALGERALYDEVLYLREQLQDRYGFDDLLTRDRRMMAVLDLVRRVARSEAAVLIEGETGTGKELVARALHRLSPRRAGPMVAVNCAAIPRALLESELFGHEKGAFTSAVGRRRGRFELADGGTIFLDEVGDIPAAMQAKLLRVLQERQFQRVGGTETLRADVRVVAATNRSLKQQVEDGRFRADLYYRLNVVKIDLPPLRDRPEDIPLLAAHFARKYGCPDELPKQLAAATLDVLAKYPWPGNVRELENAIQRACVLSRGRVIEPAALPELGVTARALPVAVDLGRPLLELRREAVARIEEQYIRQAMERTGGNIARCARFCGIPRRSLFDKLTRYRINKVEFRPKRWG